MAPHSPRGADRLAGRLSWAGQTDRVGLSKGGRSVNEERIMLPLYLDLDVYGLSRTFSWQPRNDSYIRAADVHPRPSP